LQANEKELVGFRRHPFYDAAEGQAFLATRGGQPVGRIVAIVNHAHNRQYNERRGMLGFFESVDDSRVARALFDAARKWLTDRALFSMRGPVNPSLNYTCGMLVAGFDSAPTFMMTYNPPYYERLWTEYGFAKSQDLYAYYGNIDFIPRLDPKIGIIAREAMRRFGVSMRNPDLRHFGREVEAFFRLYNDALAGTWGFVPMSHAEILHAARGMKFLIVPELSRIAEVEGAIVGMMFLMPDYNPVIRKIRGRLFPLGLFRLLRARRRIQRVRVISTNVVPRFQRWGLGLVMVADVVEPAIKQGITEAEFSWVLESNDLSRGTLERGGADRYKTYRIYDYSWS